MGPLAWLVLGLILLVVEMLTPGLFFFACFSVGAFAASLATFLDAPSWAAWVIFFAVSLLAILIVAPLARRWIKRTPVAKVGLDSLEGQTARVIEAIDPITGKGQVRLANGAIWRAVSDQPIVEGLQVKIACIIGARLQVSPISEVTSNEEQS